MAKAHKIEKTEIELINYQIDFTDVLIAAVGTPLIASVTHTSVVKSTGAPAAGIVASSSVDATQKIVEFQLASGTDGVTYTITVILTLDDSQVLQECITLTIKNC